MTIKTDKERFHRSWAEEDRKCIGCGAFFTKNGQVLAWWDYMVHSGVWTIQAGLGPKDLACLPCLEKRMGRKLVYDDFTDARCNNTIRYMLDRERYMRETPHERDH